MSTTLPPVHQKRLCAFLMNRAKTYLLPNLPPVTLSEKGRKVADYIKNNITNDCRKHFNTLLGIYLDEPLSGVIEVRRAINAEKWVPFVLVSNPNDHDYYLDTVSLSAGDHGIRGYSIQPDGRLTEGNNLPLDPEAYRMPTDEEIAALVKFHGDTLIKTFGIMFV